MRTAAALAVALVLTSAGCSKRKEPRGPGPIATLHTEVAGLSGLSQDAQGFFWASGEDGDAILRIDPKTFAVIPHRVSGAPAGADLEALAWVEERRFILGTETQEAGRARDVLLWGRIQGEELQVTSTTTFDYGLWGLTAPDNHGIEGICHVDGVLILATELVDEQRGRRWAPVAMLDPTTHTWTAHRVGLTSKTGKLAAMSCRLIDDAIVALAVERHFRVSRLLRFTIPRSSSGQWIEPTIAADLSVLIDPLPNFEGLVWTGDGSAVLVADNKYRRRASGPSRLFFIPASALK